MVDRNRQAKEQAQQQFHATQQRKQFLAALASGATGAYDKEKTRLQVGQLVIWQPPPDILYWLIKDVGPALELPQPALRATLTITVPVNLPPGQRMGNLLVIGKQGGQDPAALARDTIGVPDETLDQTPAGAPIDQAPPPDTEPEDPNGNSQPPGD